MVLRLMPKNISKLPTTATMIIVRMKVGGVLVVLLGSWGFDVYEKVTVIVLGRSFSKLNVYVPFCCASKLKLLVLSIMPRLTICSPLGAVIQKRTIPLVAIEPLKTVPAGITY